MKSLTKPSHPQTQGGRKQAVNDARTDARSKKAEPQNAKKQAKNDKPSKADQLAEKAKSLRQSGKFSGQLREINKLHRVEHDFGALTEKEAEFAAFWEYRREVEQWNVQPPTRIEGSLWEEWKNNRRFFPLPYLELKKAGVLNLTSTVSAERKAAEKKASDEKASEKKAVSPGHLTCHPMWSDTTSPAFRESDVEEFNEMLAQPKDPLWSQICKIGKMNMDAFDLLNSGSGDYTRRRTGFLSMHCVVLDWSKGPTAIRGQMGKWLKTLTEQLAQDQPPLRGQARGREMLFQLGAWRARRAGLSAKKYYEFRRNECGSFSKSDNPAYKAPKAFRTAANAAEDRLKALISKKFTE